MEGLHWWDYTAIEKKKMIKMKCARRCTSFF